jgi:hypothetical protein
MADALDLVQNFINDVTNMVPRAGETLATQDVTQDIRRNVPFQPRVPVTVAKEQQIERDDEARELEIRKQAWLLWQSEQPDFGMQVGSDEWYQANTQGDMDPHPGALNSKAADYRTKIDRAGKIEKSNAEASASGRPNNQTI